MIEEYYSPRDIHFSREEMLWLIEYLLPLGGVSWPVNSRETGYTEAPRVQHSQSHHASFESAAQIYAEITVRLESTKESGEALIDEVQSGTDSCELLSRPAKRALNYISGWRRRKQTFAQWKRDQGKELVGERR